MTTHSKDERLRECPFCESDARLSEYYAGGRRYPEVKCINEDCEATNPNEIESEEGTEAGVINAWNRRPSSAAERAVREALIQARQELWDALHSHMSEAEFNKEVEYIDAALSSARAGEEEEQIKGTET